FNIVIISMIWMLAVLMNHLNVHFFFLTQMNMMHKHNIATVQLSILFLIQLSLCINILSMIRGTLLCKLSLERRHIIVATVIRRKTFAFWNLGRDPMTNKRNVINIKQK
ncbi:hypothetical protein ACJX0J_018070, partial [Zea mays]